VPAARAALELLDARGVKKGIVTSGTRDRVQRELQAHGLFFDDVVCGTDVPERKPHPAALELCLRRLGVSPEEAVYVGDSPEDIQMARAGNVRAIAVRGSYPNVRTLVAAKPDLLTDDLRAAVEWALAATSS
jgi:HAD superfamily hydrolase (TIGR01509 family)